MSNLNPMSGQFPIMPMIKDTTRYPGQMGVDGAEFDAGFRILPRSSSYFVDRGHGFANDNNDGTNPDRPLATIAAAVSKVTVPGDVIYVSPGAYTENITIAETRPFYVTIQGVSNGNWYPTISATNTALPIVDVRAEGWKFSGLQFNSPASASAIRLQEVPGSSYSAYKSWIEFCTFDGLWGGLYGVEFLGAPHRITVKNCRFLEHRQGDGSAAGIVVSSTAWTDAYECEILSNLFYENERSIARTGAGSFNVSLFMGNIFVLGALIPATTHLDLRAGSRGLNTVTGNYMSGDYSNAGGYWANVGAPGNWVGNYAEDVVEAEVGDNGLTIAVPAA